MTNDSANWIANSFEETGIAHNDYATGLTGLANKLRPVVATGSITAPDLNLTQQIEHDNKLMALETIAINKYIDECETIGKEQAKYNFLQTGLKVK